MKSQQHNQGELQEVNVKIEKDIAAKIMAMSENTDLTVDDLVVISLKRFIASHSDYLQSAPSTD